MQMLRAGVPLPHIKEFLGHASITTTSIYATADSQMVRDAIQKAAGTTPDPAPLWKRNDLILQLAGLDTQHLYATVARTVLAWLPERGITDVRQLSREDVSAAVVVSRTCTRAPQGPSTRSSSAWSRW